MRPTCALSVSTALQGVLALTHVRSLCVRACRFGCAGGAVAAGQQRAVGSGVSRIELDGAGCVAAAVVLLSRRLQGSAIHTGGAGVLPHALLPAVRRRP